MSIQRKYTPAQTARMREEVLAGMAASVERIFARHPELQSALILVSQYWNDEADDAVQRHFIFSQLPSPELEAHDIAQEEGIDDDVNLPAGVDHLALELSVGGPAWDDNHDAIPLFAPFTKEGADQTMPLAESAAPYALFRRKASGIDVQVVGKMLRPWLDGVKPEWDAP